MRHPYILKVKKLHSDNECDKKFTNFVTLKNETWKTLIAKNMLVEKKKTNKKLAEELKAPPQQYPCKKGTDKVQIHGEETYAL